MASKPKNSGTKSVLKDPQGGLTAAGRKHFKESEGANLRPGVKGPADTPEKMKRKGSFLRRHFANPHPGPIEDPQGKPTRRALSAAAWGEPVPKTAADVKKLAAKGKELLEQFHSTQAASENASTRRQAVRKTKTGSAPKSRARSKASTAPKKRATQS